MTNENVDSISLNQSKYYSITSFIDALMCNHDHLQNIEIWIDTTMYPNTYGINVRPIQLVIKTQHRKTVLNMEAIIKRFSGLPYIGINETKYRRLTREPSMLVVNCTTKKEYEEHKYYDYRVVKLFLQDELKRYDIVHENAMKAITSFVRASIGDKEFITKQDTTEPHPCEIEIT